jgi:hypothetical protein
MDALDRRRRALEVLVVAIDDEVQHRVTLGPVHDGGVVEEAAERAALAGPVARAQVVVAVHQHGHGSAGAPEERAHGRHERGHLGVDRLGEQALRVGARHVAAQEAGEHVEQIVAPGAEQHRAGRVSRDERGVLGGRVHASEQIGRRAHAEHVERVVAAHQVIGDVVDEGVGDPRVALAHDDRPIGDLVAQAPEHVLAPSALKAVREPDELVAHRRRHRVGLEPKARPPAMQERPSRGLGLEVLEQHLVDALVVVPAQALAQLFDAARHPRSA